MFLLRYEYTIEGDSTNSTVAKGSHRDCLSDVSGHDNLFDELFLAPICLSPPAGIYYLPIPKKRPAMRLIPALLTLLFTVYCTGVHAQIPTPDDTQTTLTVTPADPTKSKWGSIRIAGRADNFAVTPSGRIFCATALGDLWHADSLNGSWSVRHFPDGSDGEHFEQTNFFNDSVGILTGYLHDDDYNDHLYRTTDGGKSWQQQPIAKGKWIDAATVLPSGHGWLASSDQVMYRTTDAGATWQEISRPENTTNQRISQLSFLDAKHGLAGTGWNRLYHTTDGGDNWRILPTPLDQKRYTPTHKGHRPRINGIYHTKDHLFVHQNDRWYWSAVGEIDWQPLPARYHLLAYAAGSNVLYAAAGDTLGTFSMVATPKFLATRITLPGPTQSATASQGKLFLKGRSVFYRWDNKGFNTYPTYSQSHPVEDVVFGGSTGPVTWGHLGRELYLKVLPDGNWYRHFRFSEPLAAVQPVDERYAKIRTASGNYLFDREELSLHSFNLRDSLAVPGITDVVAVVFTQQSQGCFHFDQEETIYQRKRGAFKAKAGGGVLEIARVQRLLEQVLTNPTPNQITALPLHPKTQVAYLEALEAAITEKAEAGKHDHPRLAGLQQPQRLREYPGLPHAQWLQDASFLAQRGELGWSTTVNTETIELRFRTGPPLVLTCQYSYAAPSYLSWRVDYGKDSFYCFSGVVRDIYLHQQLNAKERLEADAELLLQLGEIWGRSLEREE